MEISKGTLYKKAIKVIDTAEDKHEEVAKKFTQRVCLWFCKDCEECQVIESLVASHRIARAWYYRFGTALTF